MRNVAGARTDFLTILSQDWGAGGPRSTTTSTPRRVRSTTRSTGRTTRAAAIPASQTWNLLSYFKPTNLGSTASPWLDPAVINRSTDYRTPATPTINAAKGSQWQDAGENTGTGGDFYNESEAAYVFNLEPGPWDSTSTSTGAATTRYSPFFKIRQWRSAVAPQTITVGGVTKTPGHRLQGGREAGVVRDLRRFNPVALDAPERGRAHHDTRYRQRGKRGGRGDSPGGASRRRAAGPRQQRLYLTFPTATGFDKAAGAVEFWFQPTWASGDGARHDMAGSYVNATNQFLLQKLADNSLHFTIVTSGGTSDLVVTATAYGWRAYDRVHIIIQWDDSWSVADQQQLYVNGARPANTDSTVDYDSALLTPDPAFYLGNINNGNGTFAAGIYDEAHSDSLSAQDLLLGGSSPTPA